LQFEIGVRDQQCVWTMATPTADGVPGRATSAA
jgi:hypothetical protein